MPFLDRLRLHLTNPTNDPNLREIERFASRILGPFESWSTTTPNPGRPAPTALEWTGSTTNPSLGNGTLTGAFRELGDIVFVNIVLTCGTTTTLGSGSWGFTLPYPPSTTTPTTQTLSAAITSNTAARRQSVTAIVATPGITGIVTAGASLTHTTAFASTDKLIIQGFYVPA